ncbi:MAG: hypothetical protein QNJ20_18450 [Paracoccaceae bacterium]|nr:hypothetical protein [Paracoccaceae bacterium]
MTGEARENGVQRPYRCEFKDDLSVNEFWGIDLDQFEDGDLTELEILTLPMEELKRRANEEFGEDVVSEAVFMSRRLVDPSKKSDPAAVTIMNEKGGLVVAGLTALAATLVIGFFSGVLFDRSLGSEDTAEFLERGKATWILEGSEADIQTVNPMSVDSFLFPANGLPELPADYHSVDSRTLSVSRINPLPIVEVGVAPAFDTSSPQTRSTIVGVRPKARPYVLVSSYLSNLTDVDGFALSTDSVVASNSTDWQLPDLY